jgi:hypothetical protein
MTSVLLAHAEHELGCSHAVHDIHSGVPADTKQAMPTRNFAWDIACPRARQASVGRTRKGTGVAEVWLTGPGLK